MTDMFKTRLADVIRRPLITEKATRVLDINQYTFEVDHRAAKPEIKAAIEKMFTPEFRNRLDSVITFNSLPMEIVLQVVEKFILQLEGQLIDRNVTIEFSKESLEWIASEGYDSKMGARPLSRKIQEHIKKPLSEELLFGALKKGGVVKIGVQKGMLKLGYKSIEANRTKRVKDKILT